MVYLAMIYTPDYQGACPCSLSAGSTVGLVVNNAAVSAECSVFYAKITQELGSGFESGSGIVTGAPVSGMYSSAGALEIPYCNVDRRDADGNGFFCPAFPQVACFGRTGAQLLTSIGANFQSINDKNEWFTFSLVLIIISVVFKTVHIFTFVAQCQRSETPSSASEPPRGQSSKGAPLVVHRDVTAMESII